MAAQPIAHVSTHVKKSGRVIGLNTEILSANLSDAPHKPKLRLLSAGISAHSSGAAGPVTTAAALTGDIAIPLNQSAATAARTQQRPHL